MGDRVEGVGGSEGPPAAVLPLVRVRQTPTQQIQFHVQTVPDKIFKQPNRAPH